jgi:hypothetical protein
MSKRIPEFFKPHAANMSPMTVARLLGAQLQEMNKISMRTLKAVQVELSSHTETLIDHEATQRAAADNLLAARIDKLEHATSALSTRVAAVERFPVIAGPAPPPVPPASPPPAAAAAPVARAKVKHSHSFVNKITKSGKVRYNLSFKNKHVKLLDHIPRGANSFVNLQDCLHARDKIILASGCILFEGNVRGRLGKSL